MSFGDSILAVALVASAIVGLAVLTANFRRAANRAFFLLAINVAIWLGLILRTFHSMEPEVAAQWIRMASIVGGFLPISISSLRASIVKPDWPFTRLVSHLRVWLAVYICVAAYCLTPFYLTGTTIPKEGIPDAVYGSLSFIFPLYFIGGLVCACVMVVRDRQQATGLKRIELEFVLAGLSCLLGAGLFAGILPVVLGKSQLVSLAPLCFVAMNLLIAYGIATKSILSVGTLLRRGLSYLLLAAYLGAVYVVVVWLGGKFFRILHLQGNLASALLGTACVAISVGRAQTFLQIFVRKLFLNLHRLDLRATLKDAERLLTQVTTTELLLSGFIPLVGRSAGTDAVKVVLFRTDDTFQVWSESGMEIAGLSADSLKALLSTQLIPISSVGKADGANTKSAANLLRMDSVELALRIENGGAALGILALGPKLSGMVYDAEEVESLHLLANHLGVALENARLYTEQRRSREYLQTLLGDLTDGFLACDDRGVVTVCNAEAERLLGSPAEELIGGPAANLGTPFAEAFLDALDSGKTARDQNGLYFAGGNGVPIRFSSRILTGSTRGAFVLFSDLTQVKELEEQLRRSDRLAMLGTLSASLAHEIRNPLVPIKSMITLVPERAGDGEFIARFVRTVGSQIERIERLVTQLLSSSRTGATHRTLISFHTALTDVLALLAHDCHKRGIEVATYFDAAADEVLADRQQIQQVLLNLLMNSIDAMPAGGELTLRTHLEGGDFEVIVDDTGHGIPADVLPLVLDPFVTTKATGTGLGLSIAYGIVVEHGGNMDLRSDSQGTRVTLRLPLSQEVLAA